MNEHKTTPYNYPCVFGRPGMSLDFFCMLVVWVCLRDLLPPVFVSFAAHSVWKLFLFILVCHSTGFVFAVFLFAVVKYFYTMLRFLTHYSSVRLSHLTTRQLNIVEQGRRGGAKLGRMRGVVFAQTHQLSDDWEQRTKGKGAKQSIDPIMLALIPAVVLILPIIKLI